MTEHPGEIVQYKVVVSMPKCSDDGGWGHDRWWVDETVVLDATSASEAGREAASLSGVEEACKSHPPLRESVVRKIVRVSSCPERVEGIPLSG